MQLQGCISRGSRLLKEEILVQLTELEFISIITILEWLNEDSAKNASNLAKEMQQRENFNPQEIIKRNDIKVEISYSGKVKF